MRPKSFVAVLLSLAATGFVPGLSTVAQDASTAEPDASLSDRVTQLEARLSGSEREDAVRRGAKSYARYCAACHGREGAGDGPAAIGFDPKPRDLTVNAFRFRSTPTGAAPRPADLERIIRKGMPGTSMTGFGDLFSDEEIADLVWFTYSLRPATATMEQPPEAVQVPALLPDDPARADDGRAMYILMGCWTCHGMKGGGKGHAAKGLKDNAEKPIRSTDFRFDALKGGSEPEDIVRSLLTGLNGAPTPAYLDSAILVTSDFSVEDPNLEQRLKPQDRRTLTEFLSQSPSPQQLEQMEPGEKKQLRDRRLYDLAYYVLSLNRRNGPCYRVFSLRPELEPRKQ